MIDSHLHLPENPKEAEKIIKEAQEEGVLGFINIGTSVDDSLQANDTAQMFDNVWSTAGVYPHEDLSSDTTELKSILESLISDHSKIVGVGECGIDISETSYPQRSVAEQRDLFAMQVELSIDHKLPLIIHNRNGNDEILDILNAFKSKIRPGIAHCFSSDWEFAVKLLDLGFYISFSGMITYPSNKYLLETVKNVPEDRFLLETDSPWLPPQGHRGETNYPKYVKITALKVSEVREISLEAVDRQSTSNTSQVYNLC